MLTSGHGRHQDTHIFNSTSGYIDDLGHPCPKPIEVMKWLVSRCSLGNDIILDPLCGSGTTLVAAKQLGRKFIGIEISEKYCEIARGRLRQEMLF